mmetsp:Transcript_4972/g.7178  ORF Transcript_4972/g.7178 Transcript_4972/m.7178 type:complete len:340 (-) Transcript_4972:894-1913(-)
MVVQSCSWSAPFHASYTRKDLMNYALAIGFSSDENINDHCFTFEKDPRFESVPTFCLVLPSWATQKPGKNFSYIQPFPTPLMSSIGLIPEHLIKRPIDAKRCPILHMDQSVIWHNKLPVPSTSAEDSMSTIDTLISSRTVGVIPKSIGTFVESETRVCSVDGELICTLASTILILGIGSQNVQPLISNNLSVRKRREVPRTPADFEWTYTTLPNQALLYRLASGDFNKIHVYQTTAAMINERPIQNVPGRPLLHGLCTLGIAFRGLCRMLETEKIEFISLKAHFTKPFFVGDVLVMRAWYASDTKIIFQVKSETSDVIAIDQGEVVFQQAHKLAMMSRI